MKQLANKLIAGSLDFSKLVPSSEDTTASQRLIHTCIIVIAFSSWIPIFVLLLGQAHLQGLQEKFFDQNTETKYEDSFSSMWYRNWLTVTPLCMFVIRMVVDAFMFFFWRPKLNFKSSYMYGLAILYVLTLTQMFVRFLLEYTYFSD